MKLIPPDSKIIRKLLKGAATLQDLADSLHETENAVRKSLLRLRDAGLVELAKSVRDRRETTASLSLCSAIERLEASVRSLVEAVIA